MCKEEVRATKVARRKTESGLRNSTQTSLNYILSQLKVHFSTDFLSELMNLSFEDFLKLVRSLDLTVTNDAYDMNDLLVINK